MRRWRAALTLGLALLLVGCARTPIASPTPCPPQALIGGAVTAAHASASVVEVTACPLHPSLAEDPCYASTGWALGGDYVVTAGHVIDNGPLGPYLGDGREPPTIHRTDLHVVVSGRAPLLATTLTVDAQHSDLALLRASGLHLQGLQSHPRPQHSGRRRLPCAMRRRCSTSRRRRRVTRSPAQSDRCRRA